MDEELRQYLDTRFGQIDTRFAQIDARFGQIDTRFAQIDARFGQIDQRFATKDDLEHLENRLVEKMRDMQTELLRGFASFSQAQTLRVRKVEADQSNLDAALSGRVNVLENRLLEIELRLGMLPGDTKN